MEFPVWKYEFKYFVSPFEYLSFILEELTNFPKKLRRDIRNTKEMAKIETMAKSLFTLVLKSFVISSLSLAIYNPKFINWSQEN